VGAGRGLVGPDDTDLFHQFLLFRLGRPQQAGNVIAVGERDAAFAGGDRLDLVGVATLRGAREIGDHALRPGFGPGLALMGDDRGHQRQVVGVRTRTRAQLALEVRVGQVVVGPDLFRLDGGLVVDDDPRPPGEGEPVFGAQVGGNPGIENLRIDRREQPQFVGLGQARGIDRQEDIGRAVAALVPDAFEEFIFLAFDAIDPDAGLLREIRIERLVGLIVAGRVEVERLVLGLGGECQSGDGGGDQADNRLHVANSIG